MHFSSFCWLLSSRRQRHVRGVITAVRMGVRGVKYRVTETIHNGLCSNHDKSRTATYHCKHAAILWSLTQRWAFSCNPVILLCRLATEQLKARLLFLRLLTGAVMDDSQTGQPSFSSFSSSSSARALQLQVLR